MKAIEQYFQVVLFVFDHSAKWNSRVFSSVLNLALLGVAFSNVFSEIFFQVSNIWQTIKIDLSTDKWLKNLTVSSFTNNWSWRRAQIGADIHIRFPSLRSWRFRWRAMKPLPRLSFPITVMWIANKKKWRIIHWCKDISLSWTQACPIGCANASEPFGTFPTITEYWRRLSRTIRRCFDLNINKFII